MSEPASCIVCKVVAGEAPAVHLHVLPRTRGVQVNFHDPSGLSDRAELDRLAAEIAGALDAGG